MRLKRTDKAPQWLDAADEIDADGYLAEHLMKYGYELAGKSRVTKKRDASEEVSKEPNPKEDK